MLESLKKTLPVLTGSDPRGQRFLLAVSGGLDSVALVHAFKASALDFGIAHCNFKLRGADSDGDEDFVRELAAALQVPFFVESFDTLSNVEAGGGSIQMVARALRYEWLETTRQLGRFDWVVTAHHQNDAVETFFINLLRGSGLRGLSGIPAVRDHIIRPFIDIPRSKLSAFQQTLGFAFREDASNAKLDYLRNKLRLLVIPVLEQIQPGFIGSAGQAVQALRDALALFQFTVEQVREQAVQKKEDRFIVRWIFFEAYPASQTLNFELLRPYGFNTAQAAAIWTQRHTAIGSVFHAAAYECLIDREQYFIRPLNRIATKLPEVEIPGSGRFQVGDGWLEIEATEQPNCSKTDPLCILVSVEQVQFPLYWRIWKPGDRICPFGMHGRQKKVQDMLTDLRLDRWSKEQVSVLEDGSGRILWVVGYRQDERFKIDFSTEKRFWRIRYVAES